MGLNDETWAKVVRSYTPVGREFSYDILRAAECALDTPAAPRPENHHELVRRTLAVEQLMTTGGGWQDQAGAIFGGISLIGLTIAVAQWTLALLDRQHEHLNTEESFQDATVVFDPKSIEDLARFGLLIATGGVWKGKRLIGQEWLRGHAGLDVHVVAGDPETMVSIAKINTKNFPFGQQVGTQGRFSFPKELITGPVRAPDASSK